MLEYGLGDQSRCFAVREVTHILHQATIISCEELFEPF
jgi:hypothetical protein